MRRISILSGTVTIALALLVVWALAVGFSVDLAQATAQSMPLILMSGLFTALAAAVMRKEFA